MCIRDSLCNVVLHEVFFFKFTDLKKQFEFAPVSQNVEIDRQVELRCVPPVGFPPPQMYWFKNGVPLETDTSTIVSSEGHLILAQARLQDTANYTCVAENYAGKRTSDPALVTVYGEYAYLTALCNHIPPSVRAFE